MEEYLKRAEDFSQKMVEPANLPFTVAGGAVAAAVVGYSAWRFFTGASEGELTDAQKRISHASTATLPSGKTLHVCRVAPAEASACASAVAKSLVGDDSALSAVCPKGSSSASLQARASWLYSCLLSAIAPSSSGALVLRGGSETLSASGIPSAVVAVLPPNKPFDTVEFACQGGWAYIFRLTGWERRMRFPGLGETLAAHRRRLTSKFGGCFYVLVAAQSDEDAPGGKPLSILRATMQPVLGEADRVGKVVYAETTSARVAAAYSELGFEEVKETRFPVFDVDFRIFMRAPRRPDGSKALDLGLPTH